MDDVGQRLLFPKPDNRGKATLDVLFNDSPDSPPPNARFQRRSMREWLALHRQVRAAPTVTSASVTALPPVFAQATSCVAAAVTQGTRVHRFHRRFIARSWLAPSTGFARSADNENVLVHSEDREPILKIDPSAGKIIPNEKSHAALTEASGEVWSARGEEERKGRGEG